MSIHVKTSNGSVCVSKNYDAQISNMNKSINNILNIINTPSYFPKLYRSLPTGYDANNIDCILADGWGLKNTPTDDGLCILTFPYSESSYSAQLCINVESSSCDAWIRTKKLGKWSQWKMLNYLS